MTISIYKYATETKSLSSQVGISELNYDHKTTLTVNCLRHSLLNPSQVIMVEWVGCMVIYYKEGKIQRSPIGTLFNIDLLRPTVGQLDLSLF